MESRTKPHSLQVETLPKTIVPGAIVSCSKNHVEEEKYFPNAKMFHGQAREMKRQELFCTLRLFLTGIVVVLGGSFHFGYQISLINPLADVLQRFLVQSFNSTHEIPLNSWSLRLIWPSVAGQLFIGALIGAMISPKMITFIGLKRSLLFSSIVLVTSFVLSFLSKLLTSFELFIIGRFISGLGIGMSTTMQTVYLTEISPIKYRGTMGTLTGLANAIGFVLASGIGLPYIFGHDEKWQWSFIVETIPSIVLILFLLTVLPESPMILLKNGNEKDALTCLELYFSKTEAVERLIELSNEIKNTKVEKMRLKQMVKIKAPRNALILCMMLNVTVSFSGIMAVSFFGTFLFNGIGFSESGAVVANFAASFFGILGNVMGAFTIEKIGRRKLILMGLSSLTVLNTLLMILLFYFKYTGDIHTGYAFLIIFMLFLFVFSLGVGPMAWFIATELSDTSYRPWIQSISTACQYLTCAISPLIFFPLYKLIGALSFLIFITPLSLCTLYFYFYLPETKNCAIEEILQKLERS